MAQVVLFVWSSSSYRNFPARRVAARGAPLGGSGVFVERDHFSLLHVHIVGPLLHHLASLCEQVAAPIGRFHLVFDDMVQGHFRHVSREAGDLAGPVAEAGTETVGHVVTPVAGHAVPHAAHQLQQRHIGQGAAMARAGEEMGIARDARQSLQNAHGDNGEGNPMYQRRTFIRSAGTVQTAASRSISFHWACSTSLVRVAVRIRNCNASRRGSRDRGICGRRHSRGCFQSGLAPAWRFLSWWSRWERGFSECL